MNRQQVGLAWAVDTFGDIANHPTERTFRFIEEAVELAHSMCIDKDLIWRVIERIYARPRGATSNEIGQVGLTLELLAECLDIDANHEIARELERIQSIPKDEWAKRHAAKVALGIAS